MTPLKPTENRLLVEVAWEVCWQVGGIYTVLRSKAAAMVGQWGARYCLVGPYNANAAALEFEPLPKTGYFGRACEVLEQRGISVHFGRWLIPGEPLVVLIDFARHYDRLDSSKYFLWRDHHIEVWDDKETGDCVLFGYLVAEFFDALSSVLRRNDFAVAAESGLPDVVIEFPLLAHFHEWMAGVPIPVINKRNLPVSSIFTTHATLLGRYLASHDPNFYDNLPNVNPFDEAKRFNIFPKFAIERAAAHGATCFTTISHITAIEAEHILGRKADVILPNGLNIKRFEAVHEFQNLHVRNKKKIHEFVMGHFFPSYSFDLDNTLYLFTSGRYEYRNKGMDLFIESLARLNFRMKQQRSKMTVVAFIITKAATTGINVDVLKSNVMYNEVRTLCGTIGEHVAPRLLNSAIRGKTPELKDLVEDYELLRVRRLAHAWKIGMRGWPSIVTHSMVHDATDPVLAQLRSCQLFNRPDDPVKVVFHPEFLSATSPLLGMDYDQFVRGCHLGVFPSYYEPWGYTPEECAALGIPSITSDLAGFGLYVQEKIPNHNDRGLIVIPRRRRSFHESAEALTNAMLNVVTKDMRGRIELRNSVESLSPRFDWKQLIPAYQRAHRIALLRKRALRKQK